MAQEDWTTRKWRPMMGWMYMVVCTMDFIIFPILWSALQAYYDGQVTNQWNPLTLQGAGLFHMAMGAVLGVAAWSRGQEKLAGVNNDNIAVPPSVPATPSVLPSKPVPRMPSATPTVDPVERNTRND